MKTSLMGKMGKFFTNRYFLHAIFWVYNGIFLLCIGFIGFGLLPWLSGITQSTPWNVAVMGYLLVLTPITAILLGLCTRLRKEPKKLLRLFFCIEIPLIFLALVRIVFIRQLTPVLWFFTLGGMAGAIGAAIMLFQEKAATKVKQTLQTFSQEIALLFVGYGAFLVLFFFPIILAFLYQIFSEIELSDLIYALAATKGLAFFSFLFSLLFFLMTGGFFLAAPVVTTVLYYKSFQQSFRHLRETLAPRLAAWLRAGFAIFVVTTGIILSWQTPNDWYVIQLDRVRQAKTFAEKQALAKPLMEQKESIRKELRNAYLAQYRHLGDATTNIILEGYKDQLHLDPANAELFQKFFNIVASPFIYQGKFREDIKNAGERYEEIFDAPIQGGERDAIVVALKSTNTRDSLKAGLLDRAEKRVRVVAQKVEASVQNGSVAVVAFEEEFENTSDQIQEVYYEFSLPEDAVVTGLWLGPDLEYRGVIAPKGAARRTYENQVLGRTDPALLEQVGSRQYRLRVFPIPAKIPRWAETKRRTPEKNQRVKFEYVVADLHAGIPLPVFGETRNAYSDNRTERSYFLNGQQVALGKGSRTLAISGLDACPTKVQQMPAVAPLGTVFFLPHNANPLLKGGFDCATRFNNIEATLKGAKIALLLDISQSNYAMDWRGFLKGQLPLFLLLANQNTIDLYYFNDEISEKTPLTKEVLEKDFFIVSFGKTDRLKTLQSLPPEYDAVFMITDGSDFDGAKDTAYTPLTKRPSVYIIHPDGRLPAYRDDLTYQMTMSDGGVFVSLTEAFRAFALSRFFQEKGLKRLASQPFPDSVVMSVDERGTWLLSQKTAREVFPALDQVAFASEDQITKVAAGVLAKYLIRTNKPIDKIHEVATNAAMVTPYSSFIALVNDWQRRQLEQAKKQANKFQVDFDTGVEPLANPTGQAALTVGAVPEPEEWLLLALGMGLLFFVSRGRLIAFVRR